MRRSPAAGVEVGAWARTRARRPGARAVPGGGVRDRPRDGQGGGVARAPLRVGGRVARRDGQRVRSDLQSARAGPVGRDRGDRGLPGRARARERRAGGAGVAEGALRHAASAPRRPTSSRRSVCTAGAGGSRSRSRTARGCSTSRGSRRPPGGSRGGRAGTRAGTRPRASRSSTWSPATGDRRRAARPGGRPRRAGVRGARCRARRRAAASAQPDRGGRSWRSPHLAPGERALAGLSHGAAGVGAACGSWAAASGESRFRDTALEAFGYERALFDERVRNWPDLREGVGGANSEGPDVLDVLVPRRARHRAVAHPRAGARGRASGGSAPGGVSERPAPGRERVVLAGGREPGTRAEERERGTRGACERGARGGRRDPPRGSRRCVGDHRGVGAGGARRGIGGRSLCHGVAGNAEIVEQGRGLCPPARSVVQRVAAHGIDRYRTAESGWPAARRGARRPACSSARRVWAASTWPGPAHAAVADDRQAQAFANGRRA